MIPSIRTTVSPLLFSCLLLWSCTERTPSKLVGLWRMKDFAGWTCEFKADGTYFEKAETKGGVAMSANGKYSLDGNQLRLEAPTISGDAANSPNQIVFLGMVKRFTPAKSSIVWKSDDEFTLTYRNELRGEEESWVWVRQK